jgi:hypothetical protein
MLSNLPQIELSISPVLGAGGTDETALKRRIVTGGDNRGFPPGFQLPGENMSSGFAARNTGGAKPIPSA